MVIGANCHRWVSIWIRAVWSFEHIDKKAEHEFAGLTRKEKKERQNAWRKESGYNDRWTVETAFSTFKRVLGESISAQKWENVKTEIYGKIRLYNQNRYGN